MCRLPLIKLRYNDWATCDFGNEIIINKFLIVSNVAEYWVLRISCQWYSLGIVNWMNVLVTVQILWDKYYSSVSVKLGKFHLIILSSVE